VGPLFEKDPVEPLDLLVGLGSSRAGLLHDGFRLGTCSVPEPGLVARPVVAQHAFAFNAVRGGPCDGAVPERDRGDGLLVSVDLGVDESGAVIERGVDVALGSLASLREITSKPAAMNPPAAAVGYAGDLLHVDVDQLFGPITLVAAHRFDAGGSVTAVESGESFAVEDALHRRRGQPEFVADVVSSPPSPLAETHDLAADMSRRAVR
jgi:hypothetical protein